ncbi:hypothetical protein [Lentisalinibacter sediminis]|uniref:hypothetical protein n=1 Tax=Lentisalinibacter sediminis TaxID=2992237 RepID=UPI00386B7FF1
MTIKSTTILMLAVSVAACASSKSTVVPGGTHDGTHITKIAVVSDSVLADSVGLSLSSRGFVVSPANSGTDPMGLVSEKQRRPLVDAGFDAVLIVRSTNDDEGRPQNANALIYSVDTGQLVTGVTWQNGHGFGIRSSVTNQAMKANQHEAAQEIADDLAKVIPR